MKTHQTKINVCDVEQYDDGWPTKDTTLLVNVIAWFNSKLCEIPGQYRANARCEIDSVSGYEGEHYGHIEISYERPETDAEKARRIVDEESRIGSTRQREIDLMKKLQAKYPDA